MAGCRRFPFPGPPPINKLVKYVKAAAVLRRSHLWAYFHIIIGFYMIKNISQLYNICNWGVNANLTSYIVNNIVIRRALFPAHNEPSGKFSCSMWGK